MSGGSEIATLSYTVQAIDGASGTFTKIALSAEELSKQVDDLARKRADIKVGLDDLEGKAKLKDFDLQLTKLKTKVTDPEVSLKGLAQVFSGIGRADVALDRFGAKHVTATVHPSSILRAGEGRQNAYRAFVRDLRVVARWLDGTAESPA